MSSYYEDTVGRSARVAPQIRPAGIVGDYTKSNARDLTSSYCPEACATPDGIRKFHHRGANVGEPQRHWGSAADEAVDSDVRYGVKSKACGGIDECMRPGMYSDKMSSLVGEQCEKNSVSERKRPLGRGPVPLYPVSVPLDGFGAPSKKGESTASTMGAMRDVDVRFPAGAQTDRGYDWQAAGMDPTQHCFGLPSAKGCSLQETLAGSKDTVLLPRIVADYKSTVDYEIGKPRRYGFDDPADWDESKRRTGGHTKPCAANGFQAEQSTVKDLLSSWAVDLNDKEVEGEGDGDMANSRRSDTHLNGSAGGDGLRVTVNTVTRGGRDVKALATMEDEASVQQLVHPCHYVSLGVQSAYFAGGRDVESVRALAHKCGFAMTDQQIDEVFEANAVDGLCGIEQFKNAAFARGYM